MKKYIVTEFSTGEVFEIEAESAFVAGLAFRKEGRGVSIKPATTEQGVNKVDPKTTNNKEETVKTVPPANALEKCELLSPEDVTWITAKLEEKILPLLQADVSNYAKGRMRAWMPYEAPLDSANSKDKPFVPGILDDEIWQWIVDLCAKHGFKAQTCLISKGGNIKPHRDTTYAAAWAMGINLGSCDWYITHNRESAGGHNNDYYHMSLNGGEVFKFNSKHVHKVENAAADRWAINVWAIADTGAARSANIQERIDDMLANHPEVHEFIDYHQPGAGARTPKEGTTMETKEEETTLTPNERKETIMDNGIKEYVLRGVRPRIMFDYKSKSWKDAPNQEWRVITNDLPHFYNHLIETGVVKFVETVRGSYNAAVLGKIFDGKRFAVEISSMKGLRGLQPGYTRSYKVPFKDAFGQEEWRTVNTPQPGTYVFGWADLDSETSIFCEDEDFTIQDAGIVIGNSAKATKRFTELVRFAIGTMVNDGESIKKLVLTEEQLLKAFPGHTAEEIKATFDGCSVISPWLVKKIYKSNPRLTGAELARKLNEVDKGIQTNWTLRVVTNIDGKPAMIKGNAIVSGKQMHKRLRQLGIIEANEYYDVVTAEYNIKEELGTNGSFETFTIEPHHGPSYVRTNDQILAQYFGIPGIMEPTELLTAWNHFLQEAVQNISEGKDISWMVNLKPERATTEQQRRAEALNAESTSSILNEQIATLHEAGLPIGVSQTLMNMRANSVRVANLSRDHLNEGQNLNLKDDLSDIDLDNVFKNWISPAKQKKANMVMPWAYRAYVLTSELIWIAGHQIELNNDVCVYHEATQSFAMPGKEWARVAPILGGADLDDEIMIMERLVVELDGSFAIKAFLLRSPNDWAEFAIVDIDGVSGQARITYDDMPTLRMSDLQKFKVVPKTGHLPSVEGVVTKPWFTRPTPEVYDRSCAEYMWRAAQEMDLGVGGQVKAKMLQYATAGAFESLPCPNDEMIDALQAPTGTIDDMIILNNWEQSTLLDIVTGGIPMDAYWWASRKIQKSVNNWLENDIVCEEDITWPIPAKESPIVQQLMIPRQVAVMSAYQDMLKILNNQLVEIFDIQDIFESKEEELVYIGKANSKAKDFREMEAADVALDTLESIIKYYNKDKEACYKFVLKMARASYLRKQQFIANGWNSKANFDQWLYYGVKVDGFTCVDIFVAALAWYRSQNS